MQLCFGGGAIKYNNILNAGIAGDPVQAVVYSVGPIFSRRFADYKRIICESAAE
jgi:hypothetical protein